MDQTGTINHLFLNHVAAGQSEHLLTWQGPGGPAIYSNRSLVQRVLALRRFLRSCGLEERGERVAVLRRRKGVALIVAAPGPARRGDVDAGDIAGDRIAVGAGLNRIGAGRIGGESRAAAFVARGRDDVGAVLRKPALAGRGVVDAAGDRHGSAALDNVEPEIGAAACVAYPAA